jgi:hypothetical protein
MKDGDKLRPQLVPVLHHTASRFERYGLCVHNRLHPSMFDAMS